MSRLWARAAAVSSVDRWSATLQPFSRRSRLISSIISNSSASSLLLVGVGVWVAGALGVGVAGVDGDGILVGTTAGELVGCAVSVAVVVILCSMALGTSVATSAGTGAVAVGNTVTGVTAVAMAAGT